MSWVGSYRYVFNATCINIDELKDVMKVTFITQVIGIILTIISTSLVCMTNWQPICCRRKNRISSEEFAEIYSEFIQTYRVNERV